MRVHEHFRVDRPRDEVVDIVCSDETLMGLLPGSTEVIASEGDRRTTRTTYSALGRDGLATFHWTFLMDGNVRFEKECDGKVWRELIGTLEIEERGDASDVAIELNGRTKSLVPEFTIKGPMESQIADMTRALRERLEGS